jgi:4-oxalocrotonate tautomerase
MPNVIVEWIEGRSPEQKATLAAEVTEAVCRIGRVDARDVHVRFVDVSTSDWAIGGALLDGTPAPGQTP